MATQRDDELLQTYLSQAHPPHRRALRVLHDVIAAEVPEAVLALRRGVPAFRYRGRPLVSIGDARNHVSLYVMQGHALDVHAAELADYDSSRTVVRFGPECPSPLSSWLGWSGPVSVRSRRLDRSTAPADGCVRRPGGRPSPARCRRCPLPTAAVLFRLDWSS